MSTPKILLFGYGNPGRGDDGLGPAFALSVGEMKLPDVECQTDMQLQVEHVLDMQGRNIVLFVDADMSCETPFEFSEITPEKDSSYSSHAMTPQALLHSCSSVLNEQPSATFLLRIRGERFALGDDLSPAACNHLKLALKCVEPLCESHSPELWRGFLSPTEKACSD